MDLKRLLPDNLKDLVGKPLGLRGVAPSDQWQRTVMNESIDSWISSINPTMLSAVEVSGRERAHHPWGDYRTLDYPEFDLCGPTFEINEQFDVVVCEQVLEHVPDPWLALGRLLSLTAPGGHVIVGTPFLIRVHAGPGDFWRFTADGLRVMVEGAGFGAVSSDAWGNRACARANMRRWAKKRPWSSLKNDPRFPVAVWAIGQRPASAVVAEAGESVEQAVDGQSLDVR